MPNTAAHAWQFSSRVLLPIVVAGVSAILLILGVLVYTTRESDKIAKERETELVAQVISEQFEKITRDQESVTIWDEAVRHTRLVRFEFGYLDA